MDIASLIPDKQVKLQYWLDVIRQCRASGLTNQAWCEQHNISLKSYYYWIAKIRKLAWKICLEKVTEFIHPQTRLRFCQILPPKFLEISLPVRHAAHPNPAAVLHIGTITVEVFEDTSYEPLATILKAVRSC